VHVGTPGGGGFGMPAKRADAAIAEDLDNGYYTEQQIAERFKRQA